MSRPYKYNTRAKCPMTNVILDHLTDRNLSSDMKELKSILLLLKSAIPIADRPDTSIYNPSEACVILLQKELGKDCPLVLRCQRLLLTFDNWYRNMGLKPKHRK